MSAEGNLPTKYQPAGGAGDRADQSDPSWLGELLCRRRLERMLFVCQRLGSEEGSGSFDACPGAFRIWVEEMEYEVALRGAGTVPRLPASSTMVTADSPASPDGHISLDRKLAGKPIAGNRHDGFEVAGTGTQLTVWLLRHSQRKRGATDRLNLRSPAPVLDPTSRLAV
jgi:hypothetical protein